MTNSKEEDKINSNPKMLGRKTNYYLSAVDLITNVMSHHTPPPICSGPS